MAPDRMTRASITMLMPLLLSACVVFPTTVYVADEAAGTPLYERCSLNPSVPVGVTVDRPGLHATVSLVQQDDGGYVAVRYDLADRHTATLREDAITIDAKDGDPPTHAAIPHVNPVGPAAPKEPPAVLAKVLPVTAVLHGGLVVAGRTVDRHFWIAARYAGRLPDRAWITPPSLELDGQRQDFAAIRFDRRFMIARGLFNC